MNEEQQTRIRSVVLDQADFIRLTLQGQAHGTRPPWRRSVVRPVLIKGERCLQFSYFDERRDVSKNYRGAEAETHLAEALELPFGSIHLQSTREDVWFQVTKKGRVIVHSGKAADEHQVPALAHDRVKAVPISVDRHAELLRVLGIANAHGQIIAGMHGKLAQINEFLKLLEHTGTLREFTSSPINILDCGCGSAYLSLAAYHYLNEVLGIAASLTGVDVNGDLIEKDNLRGRELGFAAACFERAAIKDYAPAIQPDIVLALHACDTASDDAIFLGIRHEAPLILCAPCCHHTLNQELETTSAFTALFHDGILVQRLADLLTDTFRAQLLRIAGYKTDVVEFVAAEHTHRNLLIRAVKRQQPGNNTAVEEYRRLKEFWHVAPYLETAIREHYTWLDG